MSLFLADQVERRPGAPGQDDAMDVDFVLNAELQIVVGLADGALEPGRQRCARPPIIVLANGFAQHLARRGGLSAIPPLPRRDEEPRACCRRRLACGWCCGAAP